MIICQTLWTNHRDLLKDDFGWLSPQHHIMGWALSSLKIKEFYPQIYLYTDKNGILFLKNKIGLPYTKFLDEYSDIECQSDLWALPKLLTYAKQNQPFLHVDGDVFIWDALNDDLMSSPLIAQNIECGTDYYKMILPPFAQYVKGIPALLKKNILSENMRSYNAGILGGHDLEFFRRYTRTANLIIEQNITPHLHKNFNIIFEQLLFYSMTNKEKKKVSCLMNNMINDNGYDHKRFADFPNAKNLKYLHLIGHHKRNRDVCDWLARYLRQENEEIFLRIVNLFKKQHYFYGSRFQEVFSAIESDTKNKFCYYKSESLVKSLYPDKRFHSNAELIKFIESSVNPILNEILKYEQKIQRLCKKFGKINFSYLKKIEDASLDSVSFFNRESSNRISIKLSRNPFIEIIYTSFDWVNMQLSGRGNINIRFSDKRDISVAIIPELFFSGYREVVLDDTCINILVLTELKISYLDLLAKMRTLFPPSNDENEADAFFELIFQKVEYLIKNKILLSIDYP